MLSSLAPRASTRSLQYVPRRSYTVPSSLASQAVKNPPKRRITLLPGDGIGPEVCESVVGIFQAAQVPVSWERFDNIFDVGQQRENPQIFQELIASIARNRIALKGPLFTPKNASSSSRNLALRNSFDLFANVVPCANVAGLNTRHKNVHIDLVVIRENTQGEYSGHEQMVEPGVVQSLKVVTERSSRRIARFAFEYARREGRKKVTCIHKANIQKQTDGLFLRVSKEISKEYPDIEYNEMIIDNCCMQLVMNPAQFDIMLTGNLYGNLLANVGSGLVGGPGLVGGGNFGKDVGIFEVGARHVAADIAGQNKVNPIALVNAAIMMLKHIEMPEYALKIEKAVRNVLSVRKIWTPDLGGTATTRDMTRAIIKEIEQMD